MIVRCLFDKMVSVEELKKLVHPKNRNHHPASQIAQLAKILNYQGWRYPIKISKQSGFITSGHGRLEAAMFNSWGECPVNYQDYDTEDQEYLDVQADNAIALQAEIDLKMIIEDLKALPHIDIDLSGIDMDVLKDLEKKEKSDANIYTDKIKIPVYEPKGTKPKLEELYDLEKSKALISEIEAAPIDENIKFFLKSCAQRHVVFNYELIAEYYCHASPEVQDLMEKSALVIIDFNKALENGFIQMTKEIAEVAGSESE